MDATPELDRFLSGLNDRRSKLVALAEMGRVRDTQQLVEEITELGEQLLVADEELRAQQSQLAQVRDDVEMLAARNEELFAGAPVAYVITDLSGRILDINRAAAALLGETPARRVVKPIATRFQVSDR